MQLTDRFLQFTDQQLSPLAGESRFRHLGLYISAPPNQEGPPLLLVRQWSATTRILPPSAEDPDLRLPSDQRRWYPLQDGGLILGALRADLPPDRTWDSELDGQMRRSSSAISNALGRDLECLQLERELTQRSKQLRTLVHQLRNPLAAFRTYAQLLLRRLEPDSEHRSLVESLLKEQDQVGRYVDAIDGIGQLQLTEDPGVSGPMLLPPASTRPEQSLKLELEPLIERAQATASLQARSWRGPAQWPEWIQHRRGDFSTVEIVANLLENAFRYSPSGSAIGLALLQDGLCVWDAGPPIPEKERELIFQQGQRGAAGRERPGTGLGLALARNLANQNGGSLTLCVEPHRIHPDLPDSGNAFLLSWTQPALPATTE